MKPDTPDTDSQQALKQSARRRLIGAAFFVVVAAAVLPMVMDATPPPQLNDFRIVTADSRVTDAATPTPLPPVTADAPPPVQKEPVADTKVAEAANNNKPADVTPAPASEAPVATPPAPVAEAATKPAPAPKPLEKKADKPAEKSTGEKAADKKTTKDQYYVQVGVFADAENVKQVRAKLKAQGIPSWTEEATGNLSGKTRVKAGPFASKDAADKALAKITKAGLSGIVAKK